MSCSNGCESCECSLPSVQEITVDSKTIDISSAVNRDKETEFHKELSSLINRYSKENGSNTPDFIIATYLISCLDNFNNTSNIREIWYGRS